MTCSATRIEVFGVTPDGLPITKHVLENRQNTQIHTIDYGAIITSILLPRSASGHDVPRGPDRYYSEIHPERLRGFLDIVRHPWFVAVCDAVLGPDYNIVEVGYDMPGPGAEDQPGHRDFPSPETSVRGRRLNSLAFNITAVDCTRDLCPFEVAAGTQWDCWDGNEMFPPRSLYERYEARAEIKLPQMGDMSARTALMIHRGRKNFTSRSRPVLVLGVDAPDATMRCAMTFSLRAGITTRTCRQLRLGISRVGLSMNSSRSSKPTISRNCELNPSPREESATDPDVSPTLR